MTLFSRFALVLILMLFVSSFAEAGVIKNIRERRAARHTGCGFVPAANVSQFGGCSATGCRVGR